MFSKVSRPVETTKGSWTIMISCEPMVKRCIVSSYDLVTDLEADLIPYTIHAKQRYQQWVVSRPKLSGLRLEIFSKLKHQW